MASTVSRIEFLTSGDIAEAFMRVSEQARQAVVRQTGMLETETVEVASVDPSSVPDNLTDLFDDDVATPDAPTVTGNADGTADVTWTDETDATVIGYIVTLSSDTPAVIGNQWVDAGVETATFENLAAADAVTVA